MGKQKKDNIEEVEDEGRKKSKKATIRERGHRYRIRKWKKKEIKYEKKHNFYRKNFQENSGKKNFWQ